MKQNKGLMTEGVIWKQLLLFALPLLLGNLFQQFYNTVDSIVVGNYIGPNALAAVGASTPIVNLMVGLFTGLGTGAGVVIAQFFGAKDEKGVHDGVHTTIALCLVAGVVMGFIGVGLSPAILRLLDTPAEIMEGSVTYLQIYFMGVIALMIYNMGSGILRAIGDSRTPLYFLMVSSVVNIVLDLVFVINVQMGVAGVAWATLIAQVISAGLVLIRLITTKECYRLILKDIRFHKHALLETIRIGLPGGIQNAVVSFSNLIVQYNINSFGAAAVAGCSAYTKIDGFAVLPVMSFSMAVTTFTGQNVGARNYELALLISIVVTILLFLLELVPEGRASVLLVVNMDGAGREDELLPSVQKLTQSYQVKSRNRTMDGTDFIIECRTRQEGELLDAVSSLSHVLSASVIARDGEAVY